MDKFSTVLGTSRGQKARVIKPGQAFDVIREKLTDLDTADRERIEDILHGDESARSELLELSTEYPDTYNRQIADAFTEIQQAIALISELPKLGKVKPSKRAPKLASLINELDTIDRETIMAAFLGDTHAWDSMCEEAKDDSSKTSLLALTFHQIKEAIVALPPLW